MRWVGSVELIPRPGIPGSCFVNQLLGRKAGLQRCLLLPFPMSGGHAALSRLEAATGGQ